MPCPFDSSDIIVEGSTEYSGTAIEPQVTVYKNNKLLENGKEYTVTYSNNTEVGTAYITVEGIGNYCGTVNMEFEIYAPADSEATDKEDNGNEQKPNITMPSIPKTDVDEETTEDVIWAVCLIPLLIVLNILYDKWCKKHGKKTFAMRVEDAVNDRF